MKKTNKAELLSLLASALQGLVKAGKVQDGDRFMIGEAYYCVGDILDKANEVLGDSNASTKG